MNNIFNIIKIIAVYFLCLVCSAIVCAKIFVDFVWKRDKNFWKVIDRRCEPKILSSTQYGEHKYMTVNVSYRTYWTGKTLQLWIFKQGIIIHYVEKGASKTKPLLLFVHGFPEFWYSWRYQLEEFSKDYHCVAIDQRGYGSSEKPTSISDYHIDKMVADIHQFVKQLGEQLTHFIFLMTLTLFCRSRPIHRMFPWLGSRWIEVQYKESSVKAATMCWGFNKILLQGFWQIFHKTWKNL